MDSGSGFPGWFIAVFVVFVVLIVVGGIASTVWRVSTARKIARDAGLDPNTAAAVTLLGNDGMDTTYLASTLRSHQQQPPQVPQRSVEQRLQELQALRDKGVITPAEYDERRREILGSI